MLGKYRHKDFIANGSREYDSCVALKGGLNENRLGSDKTGYSRIDDPFIPFVTVDIDFTYSPLFGDMQKVINLMPKDYASYLESELLYKYNNIIDSADENAGLELQPCKYNLDMNYMVPAMKGGMLSAAEWLYMKLCGVPEATQYTESADLNAPALETKEDMYDDEIAFYNERIAERLQELANASDPFEAEELRAEIADLEESRMRAIENQQAAAENKITVTPTARPISYTDNSSDYANIEDTRVSDFIRSCKMFYEMIQNHAYMISSVDLGNILTTYYIDENVTTNVNFNMKFNETVDMKTTRMMHGFMSAMYDPTYVREFIPINLRKFNMTIYIHDARSFLNNTPAGAMLRRVKNSNKISAINTLASEHTAVMAICLMGCRFVSYTNNFNSIALSGVTVPGSSDVIDVAIEADQCSIYMTDMHDLVHGKM